MSEWRSRLYVGHVVHKRLAPRQHAFRYSVFAICIDVDEIETLDRRLRLFSRGRWNLMGFHDADHAGGNGLTVAEHTRSILDQAGLGRYGARIELVCYPRLLGYVFNPLSVYFAHDATGALGAVLYEVTNTVGERRSYLIQAPAQDGGVVHQSCAKQLYVSPFTGAEGHYGFHIVPPAERVVLGVDFREGGRPMLKTHFRGERRPLTDGWIARLLFGYPLMTLKVVAGIHYEALRLWLKGVPVRPYHPSPKFTWTNVDTPLRDPANV